MAQSLGLLSGEASKKASHFNQLQLQGVGGGGVREGAGERASAQGPGLEPSNSKTRTNVKLPRLPRDPCSQDRTVTSAGSHFKWRSHGDGERTPKDLRELGSLAGDHISPFLF